MVQEFQVHDLGCPIISCDVTTLRYLHSNESQGSDSTVRCDNIGMTAASSCHKGGNSVSVSDASEVKLGSFGAEACLFVCCLGDTAGTVSVWLLAGSVVPCGTAGDAW